ncbi:MAG: PEP-CTERM sorting domain-containing protein [Armatimonadetes bacterium]|nr:PEP-CTERM sorting domain-containing protein [Armatimonadota bacterium]
MNKTLFAAALAVLAVGAQAQVYSTSFEAPTFSVGDLNGQDGWSSTNSGTPTWTISGDRAKTGTQSVKWSDAGVPSTSSFAWRDVSSFATNPVPGLTASFSVFIEQNSAASRRFGFDVFYDSSDWTRLVIDKNTGIFANTNIGSGTLSQVGTLGTAAAGRWVDISVSINFVTRAVSAKVDGINIAMPSLSAATTQASDIDLFRGLNNPLSGETGLAYFDDVTYEAVPEPTTMALLALGAVVANRRRNKR